MYATADQFDQEEVMATGTYQSCYSDCYAEAYEGMNPTLPKKIREQLAMLQCAEPCFKEGSEALLNAQIGTQNIDTEKNEKNTISLVQIGAGVVLLIILVLIGIRMFRK